MTIEIKQDSVKQMNMWTNLSRSMITISGIISIIIIISRYAGIGGG